MSMLKRITPTRASRLVVVLVLLYALLRGIRSPNAWSMTHYFFNYEQGFVKRGLLGEFIRTLQWDLLYTYAFWAWVSTLVLALNVFFLAALAFRLMNQGFRFGVGVCIVFFGSPAMVYLGHTVGYAENLGLLLTLGVLRCSNWKLKFAVSIIGFSILLLVHELHFFVFYPVVLFDMFMQAPKNTSEKRWLIGHFLLIWFIAAVMAGSLLAPESAAVLHADLVPKVDFSLRADAFSTLHRTSLDNVREVWDMRLYRGYHTNLLLSLLALALPLLFLLFSFQRLSRSQTKTLGAGLVVIGSPLLLHVFGWDEMRWNALVLIHAFLVISIVQCARRETPDEQVVAVPPRYTQSAILVTVAMLWIPFPMFDGYTSQENGLKRAVDYLNEVVTGAPIIPGPRDYNHPDYKID